jgi:hypothetical protein
MKRLIGLVAVAIATTSMALVFDAIPVLGEIYTEEEGALVVIGGNIYCGDAEDGGVKDQCFIDYYKKHNYIPIPITE